MKRSIPSSRQHCDISRLKSELRAKKISEIKALSPEYIKQSDAMILDALLELEELKRAEKVLVYKSIGREVSTDELISKLLAEGKCVALPVCGENGNMEFYPFTSEDELCAGRYGIPEPPQTKPVTACPGDVIVVPALCCDKSNNRLGRGAGYYDRYLAQCRALSVCLCRDVLLEDTVPTGKTDIRAAIVITELQKRRLPQEPLV